MSRHRGSPGGAAGPGVATRGCPGATPVRGLVFPHRSSHFWITRSLVASSPRQKGWPPAACAPSPCMSPTSDLWAPACSGQGRDGAALLWLGAAPRGEGGGMYRTTVRSKSSLSGSLGSLPGRDTQGGRRLKMALKTGSPSVLLDFEIICRSYLNIS